MSEKKYPSMMIDTNAGYLYVNDVLIDGNGPPGPQGSQGVAGSPGIPGEKGDKGDTGDTGSTGSPGAKGDKGDTGDTGPPGTTTWAGITDKPSTFAPTTHDNTSHSATYIVQSNAVVPNGAITGDTKTKVTYDAKGLVTAGTDATTADIADSTDKRYCTDAQKTVIGNTSGTNSGDASGHSGLVPNTRTINSLNLSADRVLGTANIEDSTDKRYCTDAQKTVIQNTSGTNSGDSSTPAETTTTIGALINGSTTKSSPAAADQLALMDSAASNILKKLSWTDIQSALPNKPALATNAILLGTAAAAGAASTTLRSNDTIAAFDATIPAKATPGALGTTGSAAFAARRDHTHQESGGLITNTGQVGVGPSSTSEVTICTFDIPANLLTAGSQFLFRFQGTHQSQATSGILTIRMYVGATAGQTVVMATQTNAVAACPMQFEGIATVRTIGSGGTYITSGIYDIVNAATTRITYGQGGASTTAVNTTATVTVKMTAQWATSSSTNVLLIQNATIEIVKM